MDKDKLVKITNRDSGMVFYVIPELNGLHRSFQPDETKEVPFDELKKLSYLPGGMTLLENSFIIEDDAAVAQILGKVQPEYNYKPADIKRLLTEGSLEEFLDCLDFAPDGVKEIIKTMAVELEINDVAKRDAILEKLNFNVNNAIDIKRKINQDSQEKDKTPVRRRVAKKEDGQPTRRVRVEK